MSIEMLKFWNMINCFCNGETHSIYYAGSAQALPEFGISKHQNKHPLIWTTNYMSPSRSGVFTNESAIQTDSQDYEKKLKSRQLKYGFFSLFYLFFLVYNSWTNIDKWALTSYCGGRLFFIFLSEVWGPNEGQKRPCEVILLYVIAAHDCL